MDFSNRSRKNTRDQKKNCVKRTFESKVTIIRKFSILKAEGAREKSKIQTAITRASDVRFSRFFFWTCVFFRYLRNRTVVRRFERADFSRNAFYSLKYDEKVKRKFNEGGWVFQIDLAKIRGIKIRIAPKRRSSRKLRPFEKNS